MPDISKYVPGRGPLSPRIMIVGEAPSYVEVEKQQPFVGPSGKELDKLLHEAGINRSSCWVTNACKYEIEPVSKFGSRKSFAQRMLDAGVNPDEQLNDLRNEILELRPNVILALGGSALWALTGKSKISDWRGSILLSHGIKCISTYHPAHLLHQAGGEIKGYWNRKVIIFDMIRALQESYSPILELPQRSLNICNSSYQFQEFIKRYEKASYLSIDIEAQYCIPACVGLSFNKMEGLTIPLWNDGISTSDSELVSMWLLLARILADSRTKKVGQNFKYDEDKIRRLGFVIDRLHSDTMLKAFAIHPELPKNLAFNTSIWTREPFYKNEGMYEGSPHDLMIGCARDACVTLEIDEVMEDGLREIGTTDYYYNFIMQLHNFYLDIENEGFTIDASQRDKLIQKYVEWDEKLRYELFEAVGTVINANSPKQIKLLVNQNFNIHTEGTGEDDLTPLLKSSKVKEEQKQVIIKILEDRRVRKTISTYLMAIPDFDGKMRTTYFPCLETGRSRTAQQEPPIRPNMEVRDENNKKKKKALGCAFQTITKHGDIGNDVRSMYVPEPGYVFLQADSSQAEARVIFLLANDEQALHDIDAHDYHALTASWFFGGTEDDYSKKKLGYESPVRFIGKTLRHAGHLGAGKSRAATEVNTNARKYKIDISITEAVAGRALDIFHKKQPKIRGVYHAGIIEALNKTRQLTAAVPYGINAKIGGVRTFFERWGDELNRQGFSYIPQRTVSDNTKAAGIRLRKRIKGIRILVEAHDSLLFMVPENQVEDFAPQIKEEFERPIRFDTCTLPRHDLVIPCEIEMGYNYQDLSKFKFHATTIQ